MEKENYNKTYYLKNKDIINAKLAEKVECQHCKCFVRQQFLKKHMLTPKCINKRCKMVELEFKTDEMPTALKQLIIEWLNKN